MSPLLAVPAVAALGIAVLVLVARDLGRRAGLGVPGRIALVGGLGFGVIAVTIKAGIILYLDGLGQGALAAPPRLPDRPAAVAEPSAPPRPGPAAWRALPRVAPAPPGNPTTPARAALGRRLFNDPRLSADGTVACATCHGLDAGGDDGAPVSTGIGGRQGSRNAPSVINAAFLSRLFWDGRAASLEAQAQGPLTHPAEMGMADMAAVAARVRSLPAYDAGFRDAFGGPATATRIVRALAAFERTLVAADTPYDRFVRGDDGALTAQQVRGMALFDSVGCRSCHADPTFSAAGLVRPNGTYRVFPVFANDRARRHGLLVDGKAARWRVPSLRNVARTAPYFHTGSVADLEEAVRVMAVSQLRKVLSDDPAAAIAPARLETADGMETRLTLLPGRALSARDVKDIAAFLRALSGDPAGE